MKPRRRYFMGFSLGVMILSSCPRVLKADVEIYSAFKTAYFHQTDSMQPAAPDAPNAYDFAAQIITASTSDVAIDAFFTTPGLGGQTYYMFPDPSVIPSTYFSYSSGYFDAKSTLDDNFPDGDYTFVIDDYTESGPLTIPVSEIYPADIPYFTGDTWASLQSVEPNSPLTLTWNDFVPDPSASEGIIFVRILDALTFAAPFSIFDYAGTTSTIVPAGALKYGTAYRLEVIFDNRTDTPNAGFGFSMPGVATASMGFDYRTYAELTTILPQLSIAPAGTNVVLSWPTAASDFQMESTPTLPNANPWNTITNHPTVIGDFNVLTNPASGSAQFFRLHR